MNEYGFVKELNIPFENAIETVTEELKKEGFGILTTIDIRDKFKEKLNIDFKKYVILGACNPTFAHKSILAEENIGLFLPCNVIVYEKGDKTVVGIIKPLTAMGMIGNDELRDIADSVETKLKKVFDVL
ncbi:MAG: DUF302 domain-containing protein [Candidatus Latescibacteria bacterium]|jgi:uncharacterized protein (DUF302 family)|nr:DUF302 domain-containing protein [Candidatus Latescibacterota bacterium]